MSDQNVSKFRGYLYEADQKTFSHDSYKTVRGADVAWDVLGWELEADEDTEWSGYYNRTGQVLAVMVGDDRVFTYDPEDLTPLKADEYCGGCGQIGCTAEVA